MESLGLDSWCLLAAVTMLGACFQGSVGFGLSFTVVPLLTFLEPVAIPTVPLLVALPLLVGTVIRDLPDLDLRGSGWLVLGRFPGTVMGAALLWAISPELLGVLVGIILLGSVMASLMRASPRLSRGTRVAAGFASGVMGTAAGIGGPPISLLYRSERGPTMRATAGVAMLVGVMMSMTAVVVTHRWNQAHLLLAVSLLPPSLIGFWGSHVVNRRIDHALLQKTVLVLTAIAGVGVIVQALTQ